ncbi:hypothetical protein [Ramlibacter sp. AN1133]|uniref:hypothetical protein n=1 Tax=Ramlibacter sp. AN1133 TaxID=3133429 RepID=UPI0030C53FE0
MATNAATREMKMPSTVPPASEAAASLLAIVVSANGRVDPREVAELDRLRAFRRLGIRRGPFLRLAEQAVDEIGRPLSQTRRLRLSDRTRLLALQQAVADPDLRLDLCRLSAAVITADGCVTPDERLVYASLQSQWGVTDAMVVGAIMRDRVGRGS